MNLSQGAVEALAGDTLATLSGTGIALNDNGASDDTITDSGAGLGDFSVGDLVYIYGATYASNNTTFNVIGATANTLTLPTGSLYTDQSAGSDILLQAFRRASFVELFEISYLSYRNGTIPASADTTESGSELAEFSGIRFTGATYDSVNDNAYCDLYETITATASAGGDVGYARLYGGGAKTTGASTTAIRADLTVGVGSGDLRLSSLTITSGQALSISSLKIKVPQS